MKHSKCQPLLIPFIVSVLEDAGSSVFRGVFPVVQVLGRLWKHLAYSLGLDFSSRLHSAESLQQSKHMHQQQIRQEDERHIGAFLKQQICSWWLNRFW